MTVYLPVCPGRPSSEHGSPLQALQAGVSLTRALEAAAPLYHNAITTFSSLRQHVFEEISNASQVQITVRLHGQNRVGGVMG